MLAIQKYIREYGVEKAILNFKLKTRIYDHKILFKYDMIESNFNFEEVRECRGLILEKNTWNILSYPFKKFFNYGEGNAANIDLETAKCLIKKDGTFIHLHYDWIKGEWFPATSGMAEGEGPVDFTNITFAELFWNTFKIDKTKLDCDLIYMFELCTPQNIIVTPHLTPEVTLLSVRNRKTLSEISYEKLKEIAIFLNINLIEHITLKFNTLDDIKINFINMPFTSEGYVVVDDNFNRVKMKNPAYVAAHYLKSSTASYQIMEIIKTNEVDEFIATFPYRKEEILRLKENFNNLHEKLEGVWCGLSEFIKKENQLTDKSYAEEVFRVVDKLDLKPFSGLFFSLYNEKVESITSWLSTCKNKFLYTIVNS